LPLVPVVDGVAVHDKGRQEEKSVENGAEFSGEKLREVGGFAKGQESLKVKILALALI